MRKRIFQETTKEDMLNVEVEIGEGCFGGKRKGKMRCFSEIRQIINI